MVGSRSDKSCTSLLPIKTSTETQISNAAVTVTHLACLTLTHGAFLEHTPEVLRTSDKVCLVGLYLHYYKVEASSVTMIKHTYTHHTHIAVLITDPP